MNILDIEILFKNRGKDLPTPGKGTLILQFTREKLLNFLPKGGIIAEVGVAKANFSTEILLRVRPNTLVLVDAWEEQSKAIYAYDSNNAPNSEQIRRYKKAKMLARLAYPLSEVKVLKQYSTTAANSFGNQIFDIVYIDANHSHDAVFNDLMIWKEKIKFDGLLMGHDFTGPLSGHKGVATAVAEFLRFNPDWLFLAITIEHFPTFVLGRNEALNHQLFKKLYRRGTAQIMVSPEAVLNMKLSPMVSRLGLRRKAVVQLG